MRFEFKPSFERSIRQLPDREKQEINELASNDLDAKEKNHETGQERKGTPDFFRARRMEVRQRFAARDGMPYQTLVSSIIHKFVVGNLKEA